MTDWYGRSRRLLAAWRCTVQYERDIQVYWVYGPEVIYGSGEDKGFFPDPYEGNHNACDWLEVYHHLLDYRKDMQVAGFTKEKLELLHTPLSVCLSEAYQEDPTRLNQAALIDWLLENGFYQFAERIRQAPYFSQEREG